MIYKITNKQNGEIYIGKTQKTLSERFQRHFYQHKSGQTHLYRAMRKYSFDSFEIEYLCEGDDAEEIAMIEKHKPYYNMTVGGDGGDTSASENFKMAMKNRDNSYCADNFGDRMKGKKHSQNAKEKQSKARTQHWEKLSLDERMKRSKKITGKKNGMYGKTPGNALKISFNGVLYYSLSSAVKETGHSAKFLKKHGEIID